MSKKRPVTPDFRIGIIGFGAFGRLCAHHLGSHFSLSAYDPLVPEEDRNGPVVFGDLSEVARCPVVVLAVPVSRLEETVRAVAPHLRPGALVLDVGSVKAEPSRVLREGLPPNVDILATHPLFGPHSANEGIHGLKIAICPLRGRTGWRAAAFLRRVLHLKVIMTTPEEHDREAALAQGLTHLIAKIVVQMEPLPTRITTRSFELLLQAVAMVRHDSPDVFEAIERANPYAFAVRRRFFELGKALDVELETTLP